MRPLRSNLLLRARELLTWARRRPVLPPNEELILRMVYSNLRTALGNRISPRRLRRIARQSREALRRTSFEIRNPLVWPGYALGDVRHLRAATADGRGAIVASFHVGSYRFLPLVLLVEGHKVEVVVDNRGTGREHLYLEGMHTALVQGGHWPSYLQRRLGRINVLDAQRPDVALLMARALRKGHVVFVMLDGNTGAGVRKAERLHRVRFFGTEVLARSGAGDIAAATGSPVVLCLSRRRILRPDLFQFYQPLERAHDEERGAFTDRVMTTFVAELERYLAGDPGVWEEWHHLHRMQEPGTAGPQPSTPPRLPAAAVSEPPRLDPRSRCAVDSYRAFAVSEGNAHLVFEPERRRYVTVSPLGAELVRTLYRPRSVGDVLARLGPEYGNEAVLIEMGRLCSRGWVEVRS